MKLVGCPAKGNQFWFGRQDDQRNDQSIKRDQGDPDSRTENGRGGVGKKQLGRSNGNESGNRDRHGRDVTSPGCDQRFATDANRAQNE